MNSTQSMRPDASLPVKTYYTPGYAGAKIAMICFGVVLFCLGLTQIWTPLRLLAFGNRATAEVTVVIKTKKGTPDVILRDDVQIQANLERRDRSHVFWNEFSFHSADGRIVCVRANVGSQLKPLYPLINADGLPTTDLVFYDADRPESVVFPLIISTWFASGALVAGGLLIVLIGSVLLYWAKKPIEMPHLTSSGHL
jgi:hypothetical protein